LCDGTGY